MSFSTNFFSPRYVLHVCHIFGEEITTYVSLLNFRRGFLRIRKKNGEIWSELKEEVWRNKAKGERRKEIVIILWRDRALSVAKVESQNSIVAVRTLQIRNLCNIYCQNFKQPRLSILFLMAWNRYYLEFWYLYQLYFLVNIYDPKSKKNNLNILK